MTTLTPMQIYCAKHGKSRTQMRKEMLAMWRGGQGTLDISCMMHMREVDVAHEISLAYAEECIA